MKHIKLLEQFVNESKKSYDDLVNDYKDEKYILGVRTELYESPIKGNPSQLIFRFEDSFDRENGIEELKDMGFKSKHIKKTMADKAFKYRYELTLFEH